MGTISDVPAARQRPPLTKRLSLRHWAALDYAVGALFGVVLFASVWHGLIEAPYSLVPYHQVSLTVPLGLFLVLVAVTAVALRRRRPPLMLGVLLAASVALTMLTNREAGALAYFMPVAYVLYLVAATYERRQAAVRVLLAVFGTLIVDALLLDLTGGDFFLHGGLVSAALCVIIAWFTGYIVRQRRRYAVRLQQEAASKAVAEERLRIARELHDVVAHSMSVIAVQAGYGQYVIDSQLADARRALGAIQTTSREALEEMRRMLGALRQADETGPPEVTPPAGQAASGPAVFPAAAEADGAAPLFPAPGLAHLDRLVSRTAGAGVRVDVTHCGQLRELPASIDLSAYRIVQEALTNVVKHARTSSCRVLIGYGHDMLVLEITDDGAGLVEARQPVLAGSGVLAGNGVPAGSAVLAGNGMRGRGIAGSAATGPGTPAVLAAGPGPGGGHGIIGMRERVSLLGGEFSAGPRPGYGFQVTAHIPLPPGRVS